MWNIKFYVKGIIKIWSSDITLRKQNCVCLCVCINTKNWKMFYTIICVIKVFTFCNVTWFSSSPPTLCPGLMNQSLFSQSKETRVSLLPGMSQFEGFRPPSPHPPAMSRRLMPFFQTVNGRLGCHWPPPRKGSPHVCMGLREHGWVHMHTQSHTHMHTHAHSHSSPQDLPGEAFILHVVLGLHQSLPWPLSEGITLILS